MDEQEYQNALWHAKYASHEGRIVREYIAGEFENRTESMFSVPAGLVQPMKGYCH
jgi:hypothetical protein